MKYEAKRNDAPGPNPREDHEATKKRVAHRQKSVIHRTTPRQRERYLSEDAGLFRRKKAASPWSFLAEAMASLIAKNAEDAMKNGGSPTA